jgi:hypothetical protein
LIPIVLARGDASQGGQTRLGDSTPERQRRSITRTAVPSAPLVGTGFNVGFVNLV